MFWLEYCTFIILLVAVYLSESSSEMNLQLHRFNPAMEDPAPNVNRFQQIMQGPDVRWQEPKIKSDKMDVKTELDKLNNSLVYQPNWPDPSKKLGSVTAVSFDKDGNVVIFHRVDRIWNQETFDQRNVYTERSKGAIRDNTVVAFDRNTGKVVYEWGKDLFYMPHGLTVDHENNVWVTDVALHQVMKFGPKGSKDKPKMVLGTAFTPGKSSTKFCKPTSVAVLPDGDFFIADGYCNSRILKLSKTGEIILSWGQNSFQGDAHEVAPRNFFAIPHALTLAKDLGLICVADRENGRVQCFYTNNGTFHSQYHSQIIGDRIFSVDYAPISGGQLYVVNARMPEIGYKSDTYNEVRGFVINMKSKQVTSKFGPNDLQFSNPHDIAVSEDGNEVFVAELDPNRIHKFLSKKVARNAVYLSAAKPTATLDDATENPHSVIVSRAQPGSTALMIVALIVAFALLIFGIALLVTRRRKRGKSSMTSADLEYSKLMSRSVCDEC